MNAYAAIYCKQAHYEKIVDGFALFRPVSRERASKMQEKKVGVTPFACEHILLDWVTLFACLAAKPLCLLVFISV